MDTKTFRLSPNGGNDPNPTTFTQSASTIAQIAAQLGPVALMINRNENTLKQFPVLSSKADANVQSQVAKVIRARLEMDSLPELVIGHQKMLTGGQ